MDKPPQVLVEACVTSGDQALAMSRAGAARLEVCRDLDVGGLTPGEDLVHSVRSGAGVPVFGMVRPRAGSFRAEPGEVATMLREIERLAAAGLDGFVLGVLDGSGGLDRSALGELVAAAAGGPVTFHRAFDEIDDPVSGVEVLIEAGVSRVLSSGGAGTAWEGRATLTDMVRVAGDRLVVLGGGSVRADHVRPLVEETGLREVHARASAVPGIVRALAWQSDVDANMPPPS